MPALSASALPRIQRQLMESNLGRHQFGIHQKQRTKFDEMILLFTLHLARHQRIAVPLSSPIPGNTIHKINPASSSTVVVIIYNLSSHHPPHPPVGLPIMDAQKKSRMSKHPSLRLSMPPGDTQDYKEEKTHPPLLPVN